MVIKELSSSEESKAQEIFTVINRYYSEVMNNQTSTFTEEFLNDLNFEVLNRKDIDMRKRNLIIIGNTYSSIDLTLLHAHLIKAGIKKEFVDKSIPYDSNDIGTKLYLVVHSKLK